MRAFRRGESYLPAAGDLEELFLQRHGSLDRLGWATRRRFEFGYYLPAEVYEAVVKKQVGRGRAWLDVGGGHDLFPNNPGLARSLASACPLVVAVDPSANVRRNAFVHRRVQCFLEDYESDEPFDLATMQMVAEHVADPERFVQALSRLVRPGGVAVLLTVNLWSPITFLSRLVPFRFHHALKKLVWGGEEEDTFPVRYRMNTRRALRRLFERAGFRELGFAHLDDLSAFGRFKFLNYLELLLWRCLRRLGLRYPENCLLGVYEKQTSVPLTNGVGTPAGKCPA